MLLLLVFFARYLFIAVLMLLAAIMLGYWRLRCMESATATVVSWRDAMQFLRTGDVVAFSSSRPTLVSRLIAVCTGSCYLHVGIVVGTDLLHYTAPGEDAFYAPRRVCATLSGPNLSDTSVLLRRFANERGFVAVMRPVLSRSAGAILDEARKFCGTPYDMHFLVSFLMHRLDPRGYPDRMQCITFVGTLLERLGMLHISPHPLVDYAPVRLFRALARSGFAHAGTLELRTNT
jgi:hypothetical protein